MISSEIIRKEKRNAYVTDKTMRRFEGVSIKLPTSLLRNKRLQKKGSQVKNPKQVGKVRHFEDFQHSNLQQDL